MFLAQSGTEFEKKAKARKSQEYQDADKYYLACELEWKKVKYQRSTADIAVSAIRQVHETLRIAKYVILEWRCEECGHTYWMMTCSGGKLDEN